MEGMSPFLAVGERDLWADAGIVEVAPFLAATVGLLGLVAGLVWNHLREPASKHLRDQRRTLSKRFAQAAKSAGIVLLSLLALAAGIAGVATLGPLVSERFGEPAAAAACAVALPLALGFMVFGWSGPSRNPRAADADRRPARETAQRP